MQVKLDSLTKVFGTQKAVDAISFQLEAGVTGFLGPNGAGKSTTMRMLCGYLEPSSGQAWIDGKPVWPSTKSVRSLVGYLPEHNPLYTDMYVREYLTYVGHMHRLPNVKKRVAEVVDMVGLNPEIGKPISSLSKGYRQRVGLGQAILHDPPVLILDEPTSGFDPNQLADIRALIQHLGETKIVLLSTHIMQEVQALCQRALIIDKGRLLADDTIEGLRERGSGAKQVLMACLSKPDASKIKALPGVRKVSIEQNTAMITHDGGKELRPDLAALAVQHGWGLLEMRENAASVEGVFQALTRQNAGN